MPDYDFSQPNRQSPKGILVVYLISVSKFLKSVLIPVIIPMFLFTKERISETYIAYATVFVVVFLIGLLIKSILDFYHFKFYNTNTTFILQKGILNKDESIIPHHNIQNVSIKQGLIHQIINVVALNIETSGADSTEIEIKALNKAKAESLQNLLLKQIKQPESENETETSFADTEKKLYNFYHKISLNRLLLEGLTQNHLNSMGLILAFAIGLYQEIKDLASGHSFFNDLQTNLNTTFSETFGRTLIFGLLFFVLLSIVSLVVSVVKIALLNYNLTFKQSPSSLVLEKGLINKYKLNLDTDKVQSLKLKTNRLKVLFNLFKIQFQQIHTTAKQVKHFSVVGLTLQQAKTLIYDYFPAINQVNTIQKPSVYLVIRKLSIWLIFIGIAAVIILIFRPIVIWILIPVILYAGLESYFSYKKLYYKINDTYLILGDGGLVATTTTYFKLKQIQAVSLQQTLFQKRHQLASLKLYLGDQNTILLPYINAKHAQRLLDELLYIVEADAN